MYYDAVMGRVVDRFAVWSAAVLIASPILAPAATPVGAWLERLRDPGQRREAAYGLRDLGSDPKGVFTELLLALKDFDPFVRRYVAGAIGETALEPERAIPALLAALDDTDQETRGQAAVALGKMGPAGIPQLIRLLASDKEDYAVVALTDIGVAAVPSVVADAPKYSTRILKLMGEPANKVLLRMAHSVDPSSRRAVFDALREIGISVMPQLKTALETQDEELRRLFALTIVDIAARAEGWTELHTITSLRERLMPPLLEVFRDRGGDPAQRALAARALAAFPNEAADIVPALIEALKDTEADVRVREAAAASLGAFKDSGELSVPVLTAALGRDQARQLRLAAATSLQKFGRQATPAIPLLIAAVKEKDSNGDLLRRAASVLYAIGPEAKDAIPTLSEVLLDEGRGGMLRGEAAYALSGMGRASIEPLTNALERGDKVGRSEALRGLRNLGKDAEPALPALVKALRDKDDSVRRGALEVLTAIGRPSAPSVLAILDETNDEDLRERAVEALGKIGAEAKEAFTALVRIVENRSAPMHLRAAAARAVASFGLEGIPVLIVAGRTGLYAAADVFNLDRALGLDHNNPDAAAVRQLLARLRSGATDNYVREACIRVLRSLRGGAAEAVPDLIAILQVRDSPEPLRSAAVTALMAQGVKGRAAAGVMMDVMGDRSVSSELRAQASQALGTFGDKSAVPALVAALQDGSEASDVRQSAARSLGQLGQSAVPAISALADLVRQKTADNSLRKEAIGALANLREQAVAAVPALLEVITDPEDEQLRDALAALAAIGGVPAAAAPMLARIAVNHWNLSLVRRMGAEAEIAVPLLKEVLGTKSVRGDTNVQMELTSPILNTLTGLGRRGVEVVIEAAVSTDADVRLKALSELSAAAAEYPEVVAVLIRALRDDPEHRVRLTAANALLTMGTPPRQLGPILTTILNDDYIRRHVPGFGEYERVSGANKGAKPAPPPARARTVEDLPVAWEEPPLPSAKDELPATMLVGSGGDTLRDVHGRLMKALAQAGFDGEIGLFHAPGGFMLVTRVERIHEDGTPFVGDERWSKEKIPLRSLSLVEYLRRLFLEKPGQFRFFAFIVTTAVNPETGGKVSEEMARELPLEGARGDLPETIAARPFAGLRCHVWIYHFEKKLGEGAQLLLPSAHSAHEHLATEGIWNNLAQQPQ